MPACVAGVFACVHGCTSVPCVLGGWCACVCVRTHARTAHSLASSPAGEHHGTV